MHASTLHPSWPPCAGMLPIQPLGQSGAAKADLGICGARPVAPRSVAHALVAVHLRRWGRAAAGNGWQGAWHIMHDACGCMHGKTGRLQPTSQQGSWSAVKLPAAEGSWAGTQAACFPTCSVLTPPPGHVRSATPPPGAARPSAHSEVLQSCGHSEQAAQHRVLDRAVQTASATSNAHPALGGASGILLRSPGWTAQQGGTRALLPCREPPPPGPPEQ